MVLTQEIGWSPARKSGGPHLRKSGGSDRRKSRGPQPRKSGGSEPRKFCSRAYELSSGRLYTGCRWVDKQIALPARPARSLRLRFWQQLTVSMRHRTVHFRSSSQLPPADLFGRLSGSRSPPWSFEPQQHCLVWSQLLHADSEGPTLICYYSIENPIRRGFHSRHTRPPDIAPCGGQIPELFTAGNSDHTCSVYLGRVAGKCRIRRAFPQLGCVPMPVRFLLAGMNSQLALALPVVAPSDPSHGLT